MHSELHHMSECIVLPPSLFLEASNPAHISLNLHALCCRRAHRSLIYVFIDPLYYILCIKPTLTVAVHLFNPECGFKFQ